MLTLHSMSQRCLARVLLAVALSSSAQAVAQDDPSRDVAVDAFLPSPDQVGFTGFAGSRTPGHLGMDTTLWLDYSFRTLRSTLPVSDVEGRVSRRQLDFVEHRLGGTLAVQLGILARGAVALRMPFVLFQSGYDSPSGPAIATVAAGNPAFDGRVRLLGAKVRPDGSVADGAALALRGIVHVPIGTSQAYLADENWRTEAAAIADIEMFGIGAGASFSYRYRQQDELRGLDFGGAPGIIVRNPYASEHVLRLSAGLRLPLPLFSRIWPGRVQEAGLLEVDVQTPARDFFADDLTPVEGRIGYRIGVGDLTATLSFGAALRDAYGGPDFRTLLAIGWSPRQHDQDADGVPDGSDKCVHLPEDRDGFEDDDGCADDDNDGDLIVDEDDRCPLQPAEMGRDDDEDGCTDP